MNALNILVVDDSVAVMDRITELLKDLVGVDLGGSAHNIQEASHFMEHLSPDIVVLDLQLPDGNGFDVLKAIKKEHPEIVVIVLTNSASLPVRKRCLLAGADFFLDKSDEFEKLPQIIMEIAVATHAATKVIPLSQQATSRKAAL